MLRLGQTLMYRLSLDDLQRVAETRGTGGDGPLGSAPFVGQVVPLVVTRILLEHVGENQHAVNGQALLDGPDRLWVTTVREGDEPGQWSVVDELQHARLLEMLEIARRCEQQLQDAIAAQPCRALAESQS